MIPEQAKTKHAEAVEALREEIEAGRLVPGQRLVEADLTRELGVSRSLLREALRQLSAEGAIELIPNRGAVVRRLSKSEALELWQIRIELEALAARLAAGRLSDPAVRAQFQGATAEIWDETPRFGWQDYIAENERFHTAIFLAAGNTQLLDLSRRLQLTLVMAQIRAALTAETLCRSLKEHRQIAEALLSGDAARADREVRTHLERAGALMVSMPERVFRTT